MVVEYGALLSGREMTGEAGSARGCAEAAPERAVGELLARDRELPVADEVEDDRRLSRAEHAGGDLAPAQPVALELRVGHAARRLLAVEEDDDQRGAELPRLDRARELPDDRRPRSGVVRANESRQILRVVVRTDHDLPARVATRDRADDVPQPSRHGLVAAVRGRASQDRGELAGGAGSRRPRSERDLALEEYPRRAPVEPVRLCARFGPAERPRRGNRGGGDESGGDEGSAHGGDGASPATLTPAAGL